MWPRRCVPLQVWCERPHRSAMVLKGSSFCCAAFRAFSPTEPQARHQVVERGVQMSKPDLLQHACDFQAPLV